MNDQIVELVIYKVKQEYSEKFQTDTLLKFRELVKGFGGIISMQTFSALDKQDVYFDYVVWDSLDSAKAALQKFEDFKQKGENLELLDWFEEVTFMDHFKLAA